MTDEKAEDDGKGLGEESFSYETEYEGEAWDIPDEEASRLLKGLEGLVPDIVKRTMSNLLVSDEGLRTILAEKKLPKEVLGYVLGQVDATRRGILRIVSKEIRVFLENVDFGGEVAKILTTLSFEIRTEIRFIPNEERVVPNVKNTVRVKRSPDDEGEVISSPDDDEDGEPPAGDGPDAGKPEQPADAKKPASRWTRRKTQS